MLNSFDDFMHSLKFLPKEQGREKLRRFYKSTTRKLGLEYIMVTDDEIKARDFSAVTKFFSHFDKSWRAYEGKVLLNIDGYNDVDDELFEIPEVVSYFKELYLTHPHYLFYLDKPTGTFDLAVRFLAEGVEMFDVREFHSEKEAYENIDLQNLNLSDFAYFQATMNNEIFTQLTQGLTDWFGAKGELATAFKLLKRISDDVIMNK